MITADERALLALTEHMTERAVAQGYSVDEVWGDVVAKVQRSMTLHDDCARLMLACSPARVRGLLLRLEASA